MISITEKQRFTKTLVLFSLIILSSGCQTNIISATNQIRENVSLNSIYSINGKVEFPISNTNYSLKTDFSTKATLDQVGNGSTVSLIYSSDHTTLANQTIATGLTDNNGNFNISTGSNFIPNIGDIFVLEAIKRIGTTGNSLLSVRTYIKWTGTKWDSISFPSLKINAKTSAIALIDGLNTNISANDCIGKIDTNNGDSLVDIGEIKTDVIQKISDVVNILIANNEDPTRHIMFSNGKYSTINPANPAKSVLVSSKYCPSCDLKNENLSGLNLSNSDLSSADLSNVVFTNSNLTNSNLSNTKIKNAVLTGANFKNTIWKDNSYCLDTSIGICNSEFKITENNQQNKNVVISPSGNFIVVWQGSGVGDSDGIFAQIFNSSGLAQGQEFKVNSYTTGIQDLPSVAVSSTGSFVITWSGEGVEDKKGIYAQRYNELGIAQGGNVLVNNFIYQQPFSGGIYIGQDTPKISINSTGDFIIAWNGIGINNKKGIYCQRFSSSGVSLGNNVIVKENINSIYQTDINSSINNTGDFVVSWIEVGAGSKLMVQRYDSNGMVKGNAISINSFSFNHSIVIDSQGGFIIVWTSNTDIYYQKYNLNGVAVNPQTRVNYFDAGEQNNPSISIDSSGNFIILWDGEGADFTDRDNQNTVFCAIISNGEHICSYPDGVGDTNGVFAQRFKSDGTVISSQFKVNKYTTGNQLFPQSVMDSNGNFLILWKGEGLNESNGIFAKRYKF